MLARLVRRSMRRKNLSKLESALTSAKNEVAEQDAKFGFLRDYEKAEQYLSYHAN